MSKFVRLGREIPLGDNFSRPCARRPMKKEFWLIVILTVILTCLLAAFVFLPAKKLSVGPGMPPWVNSNGLTVFYPNAIDEFSSPLKVAGVVNGGGWAGFEGQVGTVKLLDYKGNELASGILTATTEWTQLPTSFGTTLNFTAANSDPATLVFHNENPSGDPVRDKAITMPIKIKASGDTMTVKAFFAKNEVTGSTCNVVFPVDRIVSKNTAIARVALEELLKGPTEAEKSQGYFTSINPGVKIQSLNIDNNGTAKVDFSSELESPGGSCRVAEIRSEINSTLKQFLTIKNVVISINGNTESILQP